MSKNSASSEETQILSPEEIQTLRDQYRKQTIRKYLTEPIRKKIDLKLLLAAINHPKVGTKVMCDPSRSHVAPFDVLFDIVSERALNYVIWASRSGSKTYLFGGLATWILSCQKPKYGTMILGGSKDQSVRSYKAMSEFQELTDPGSILCPNLMKTRAEFSNGAEVNISSASITAVRGAHQQRLLLDEVDEISADVYEAALSQPQSLYGHAASLGMFSTNHNVAGQMDVAIERAKKEGHPVYQYCVFETLESCRDYECSTCPLTGFCPGKQMKEADGYYKIVDFITKLQTLSMSSLQRDWFCNKVGLGDTVYDQEWDESVHLVNTSLRQSPVVLSIDWGGVAPFSIGVWQQSDNAQWGYDTWVRVTELYLTSEEASTTNTKLIEEAKKRPWWKLIREIVVDNSRPDLIEEWHQACPRARILTPAKDIDKMIEAVKDALAPVGSSPRILVNRTCVHIRREAMLYKVRNNKPIDRDNHTWDETGYFVMAKIKRNDTSYFGVIERDIMP